MTGDGNSHVYTSDMINRAGRAVIVVLVALLISIASVSFAVHHMRLQFEDEFRSISDTKIHQVADCVSLVIAGDEIANDPASAAVKYASVLNLMLADTTAENLSTESYGLFSYTDGHIEALCMQGSTEATDFSVATREISEWLKSDYSVTVVEGENYESIIVPITNSSGVVVAVFEYRCVFNGLVEMGDSLESRIFIAVLVSFAAAVVLFIVQEIVIYVVRKKDSSGGVTESSRGRERRLIASTIGYCFTTILVVLFVMSSQLTQTYVKALESERADTMQSITIAEASALGYTEVAENMSFPLPEYSYAEDKEYVVNLYTLVGDSFLRLYSSTVENTTDQYYLANAGEEYLNCFDLQEVAFTSRTDGDTEYVCAIAPIISSENTVAGILEYCMPRTDFEATVNGMSLSWIFTIISIAISMGIIIFEFNLLVSTVAKGVTVTGPVLVMYGENANRLLSFFATFGSVMIPVSYASYFKNAFEGESVYKIQGLIALTVFLYVIGFFGFSSIRKAVKEKLTGRIALVTLTSFGYFLALIAGITENPIVEICLALPTGFCFGMPLDYLRTYRINAGRLGYADFDDRTIHNVQETAYMLGVSVGVVIAGICYERYGIFVVSLISGAALVLTSVGMIHFMKNNTNVKESDLTVSGWLSIFNDRYAGKFLKSSFFVLGVDASFLLVFIPNFLGKVGISLATASFYYLVCAFMACFVTAFIKARYASALTSKTRVVLQSVCTVVALLLFALMPTAKMLVLSVALLGIALGIHDFYYIYVLFLICNNRIRANLRKCAEMTFFAGFWIMIPVFMAAFMTGDIRMVMLITLLIVAILAFVYPMAPFSDNIDRRDRPEKQKPAPAPAPQSAPEITIPADNTQQMQQMQQMQHVQPVQQAPQSPYMPVQPAQPQQTMQPPYNRTPGTMPYDDGGSYNG